MPENDDNMRFLPIRRLKCFLKYLLVFACVYLVYRTAQKSDSETEKESEYDEYSPNEPILNYVDVFKGHDWDRPDKCPVALPDDTYSAIDRAKTMECKAKIARTSCLSVQNLLFSVTVKHNCPMHGEPNRLGCFVDDANYRIMEHPLYYHYTDEENDIVLCVQNCFSMGYPYAGMQNRKECHCSHYVQNAPQAASQECEEFVCPGDPNVFCGGTLRMSIYNTGFSPVLTNRGIDDIRREGAQEREIRIVFLIAVNLRTVRQIRRMIRLMYRARHYYWIHVDLRSNYTYQNLLSLNTANNIHIEPNRYATTWGGTSFFEMEMKMIHSLTYGPLSKTWTRWDYLINLSESDMLLQPLEELERILSLNYGRNFLRADDGLPVNFLRSNGVFDSFVECDMYTWFLGPRRLSPYLYYTGASDWFMLHSSFVTYMAADSDELTVNVKQMAYHSVMTTETVFHVLLLNSRFCYSFVDANLRFISWLPSNASERACFCGEVVDICGCRPKVIEMSNLKHLSAARHTGMLFARKFDPTIDLRVINTVENWIAAISPVNNALYPNMFIWSLWNIETDAPRPIWQSNLVSLCNYNTDICPAATLVELSALKREAFRQVYELVLRCRCNDRHEVEVFVSKLQASIESSLSHIELGLQFGTKERVYSDLVGIATPADMATLFLEFEEKEFKNESVYYLELRDPRRKLMARRNISVEFDLAAVINLPLNNSAVPSGIWNLVLFETTRSDFDLIGDARLLVLESGEIASQDQLDQFFSVVDVCGVNHAVTAQSCEDAIWSTCADDPVSELIFGPVVRFELK